MIHELYISIPLKEPIYVFTVLIGIILISPFLFRLIKFPDVAAFFIVGILIGPHGAKILDRDASIELFGTIGLLYLMFVAGLELDPGKLKLSKKNSVVFGLLTFILPFILGFFVCRYLLSLDILPTLMVAIMFSTHTLVAYPIVRRLGIKNDNAVVTAIGGTIITDTLVLLILSVITLDYVNGSFTLQLIRLIVFFGAYLIFVFYSFPKIARWFFKNIKRDRPVHFLFLLLMVSISSNLAKIIDVEPIIGAFVAGLALNKVIPKNSQLMHHVDFVGNILFIPIFLIGTGMLINTKIIFSGTYLWYVASVLIIAALAGKWIASFVAQKILDFSGLQRNVLFGLSSSHAAATIAIIMVGFDKGIIDETIFNSTILIILISCLIASFVTEKYGKRLSLASFREKDTIPTERIMVPISNPETMANLISVANCFQSTAAIDPVYVLSIVNDDNKVKENLKEIRATLEDNVAEYNHLNENVKVITRVDLNVSSGIIRAAREYLITDIVFGWSEKATASQRIFGTIFDHLFEGTNTLYACCFGDKFGEIEKLIVHLPVNIEKESTFMSIITKIARIPLKQNSTIEIRNETGILDDKFKQVFQKKQKLQIIPSGIENQGLCIRNEKNCMHIVFLIRKDSVSYDAIHNSTVQRELADQQLPNYIIVVPGFE